MREEIQCLIDWLNSNPNDDKPHRILRALAEESLKKADLEEEKRRFTNKHIVAAAKEPIKESKANKWVNWRKTALPYWKAKKTFVIKLARERGLDCYPELDFYIPEKAGRGNESLYWLKAEPLPETSDNEEEQNPEVEPEKTLDKSRISFKYDLAENGEVKPARGAKWLFRNGQICLTRWHSWVILGSLFIVGFSAVALSYLGWLGLMAPRPVTTRELTAFISIFAFPYVVWVVFIKPWVRLFEDRIVVAPELLVALEEKSAQLELYRDGDLRMIRLVSYTAPCPICGATVHLSKGEPDYPRRLVGRCSDSPREHIFSFDRVTRKGTVLRSPTA